MNPWLVVLALIVLAALFVVAPLAAASRSYWRRPWQVRCPREGRQARISVQADRAALGEVLGRPDLMVSRCSVWRALPHLRLCRQECLTLPPDQRQTTTGWRREGGIRTIVVPLDGTPGSESVLDTAADFARAHQAHLRLLRVTTAPPSVRAADDRVVAYADQEAGRIEGEARAYLTRVAHGLGVPAVETVVRFGDSATEIVDEADRSDADLIVMATHHRRGLARMLRGSVAAHVARRAAIPVVLVPYAEPAVA